MVFLSYNRRVVVILLIGEVLGFYLSYNVLCIYFFLTFYLLCLVVAPFKARDVLGRNDTFVDLDFKSKMPRRFLSAFPLLLFQLGRVNIVLATTKTFEL